MKRLLLPAVFLLATAGAQLQAAEPESAVLDRAQLFSGRAREQATRKLIQLEEQHGYPLFVHSVVLEQEPEKSRLLRFFKNLRAARSLHNVGQKRADEAGVRGLYVFLSAEPRAVQVIAWPRPEENLVSKRECDVLAGRVDERLKKEGPDAALRAAVSELEKSLREESRFTETPLFFFAVLAGGLAALWLVLTIGSRQLVKQPQASAGEHSSFGTALLAAQLGLPAGGWIYDRFFLLPRELLPEETPPEPLLAPTPPPVVETTADHEQGADTSASL
jgi:hypothetical protein